MHTHIYTYLHTYIYIHIDPPPTIPLPPLPPRPPRCRLLIRFIIFHPLDNPDAVLAGKFKKKDSTHQKKNLFTIYIICNLPSLRQPRRCLRRLFTKKLQEKKRSCS